MKDKNTALLCLQQRPTIEKVKVNVGCLNGHLILGSKCGYFCLLMFSVDIVYFNEYLLCEGHMVVQLDEALYYKPEGRVRFPMVSLEFFIDVILLAAQWPWG